MIKRKEARELATRKIKENDHLIKLIQEKIYTEAEKGNLSTTIAIPNEIPGIVIQNLFIILGQHDYDFNINDDNASPSPQKLLQIRW